MSNQYETFYCTTEKRAKTTRAFRNGLLLIDEVAQTFTAEIDRLLQQGNEYQRSEQYRNKCMIRMYNALAHLLQETT